MADARDLKSWVERRAGSSPALGTKGRMAFYGHPFPFGLRANGLPIIGFAVNMLSVAVSGNVARLLSGGRGVQGGQATSPISGMP